MEVNTIEVKHIFIDIVNYTYRRSVEAQTDLISYLNNFVKETIDQNDIDSDSVIYIPTGDGMCISLLNVSNPYDIHIKISLEILEKISQHNLNQEDEMRKFHIRIGLNENIDNLIIDINGNKNISGSGINNASRIEGLCDYNQILVSDSIFDKLVHREKYMNSFYTYIAYVKHDIELKIHQYTNKELTYLNNSTPSKFKPREDQIQVLTKIQAYYIANCIKLEEFISEKVGSGKRKYSLKVLLTQLSEDFYEKSKVTRLATNPRIKIERSLNDQFDYIQSIDFWIICDLSVSYERQYLRQISNCFSEGYLFVNDYGKQKLKKDFPKIYDKIVKPIEKPHK